MKHIHIKLKLFSLLVLLYGVEFLLLFARTVQADCSGLAPTLDCSFSLVSTVINAFIGISAVVFFFMILIAGYLLITAGGDAKKVERGRKSLFYSVIGFGLIFMPFIIFQIIGRITSVSTGLLVSNNGNLTFNPLTSYTPTVLPSYLINTTTPTPSPTGTGGGGTGGGGGGYPNTYCGSKLSKYNGINPIDCVPYIQQYYTPGYTANLIQYNSLYPINDYRGLGLPNNAYGGYTCMEAAIVEDMAGYYGALAAGSSYPYRVWQVLQYMISNNLFGFGYGTVYNSYDVAGSANYASSLAGGIPLTWTQKFITMTQSSLQAELDNGKPFIVNVQNWCPVMGNGQCLPNRHEAHFLVVTGYSGNDIYVADPADISVWDVKSSMFWYWDPTAFIELKPTIFGG